MKAQIEIERRKADALYAFGVTITTQLVSRIDKNILQLHSNAAECMQIEVYVCAVTDCRL